MKNKILLLIIVLIPVFSFSQELLKGLSSNALVKENFKKHKNKTSKGMLTLPFFDDFSGTDIFPNDTLWSDKNVFINSSFPDSSFTYNVATFDALNDTGALYPGADSYGFPADTLTSQPIRLDKYYVSGVLTPLKIKDSVYFSFYYQPQGNGNSPDPGDSLVLEFYSPTSAVWKHVWSTQGMTLTQFQSLYHVLFKQVMIPITDSTSYFQQGFRFRFCNYASVANLYIPSWAGNVDQWNLSYIYLNKGRTLADSFYTDIAFAKQAPSVLKNYNSMPWNQYNVNPIGELKDNLTMTIYNLDTTEFNTSYKYTVSQIGGSWTHTYDGGSGNVYGLRYDTNHAHAHPPIAAEFSFPSVSGDSASFLFTHVIKEGLNGDDHRKNDTTVFVQKFFDYYAYDDGVPEAGYGLTPANSLLAYKFTLNQKDTLRAVKMFFNQTLNNASQQYFELTVWDDAGGYPNNVLYHSPSIKPIYEDSLNKYHTYRVDPALALTGTFYVGWNQATNDFLNIGFDMNNDEHSKIFYNVGSGWENSMYAGALMIRPVFGKALPVNTGTQEYAQSTEEIKAYPNPSSGNSIHLFLPEGSNQDVSKLQLHLFDMLGHEICNYSFKNIIDISDLRNGIYLLTVTSDNSATKYFTRLSIIK